MRISKQQADSNRARIVDTASRLFRERGFDGASLADLMKAAGFTHGGFYNHFKSKDELATKALKHAFAQMAGEWSRCSGLADLFSKYLSALHRKATGQGCPAAALAGDTSRQPEEVRSQFAVGLEGMIGAIEQDLPRTIPHGARRSLSIDLVSRMVGALALSRTIPSDNPLAAEILESVRASSDAAISSNSGSNPDCEWPT